MSQIQLPDTDKVIALMRDVAEAEILPRFRELEDHEISEKTGPNDLVTIADIETEKRLTPELQALLDGSLVIGEEAVAEDESLLDALNGDKPVWIIDPVDGTMNFTKGLEKFCIIVALSLNNETIGGWIYDPLTGRAFVAESGAGSWLHAPGQDAERLAVKPDNRPFSDMNGSINVRFLPEYMKDRVRERSKTALADRAPIGCAGHEYINLLTGKSDLSLYWKNMPWDHAAGCLLHREAGGYNARFNGQTYRPGELEGGILCAPSELKWQAFRTLVELY